MLGNIPKRSPVVWGLGGREGASYRRKGFFCYEMHFKHDLPHGIEAVSEMIWLKSTTLLFI